MIDACACLRCITGTATATASMKGTSCEPPLTDNATPVRNDCEVWSAVRSSVVFADEGYAGRGCTHCWGLKHGTTATTTATATDTTATTTSKTAAVNDDKATAGAAADANDANVTNDNDDYNSSDYGSDDSSQDTEAAAKEGPSALPGVSRNIAALFLSLVLLGLTVAVANTIGVWSRQQARMTHRAAAVKPLPETAYLMSDTRSEPDRIEPEKV
jgi:hypothetical protein